VPRPTLPVLRDRFHAPLDARAAAFSGSTREDLVLLPYDLWGSLAHARMLGATGLIDPSTTRRLEAGLRAIGARAARGTFPLDPALEDVHLNVEAELTRRLGDAGARLHTARSRNDQVAVDLLLYLRDALLELEQENGEVAEALLRAARRPDGRTVVAGWTHLQPAQAVYWSQILGSHALRFVRDAERCAALRRRIEESPLGAGALAGSSLPIDRERTARWLGFRRPSSSSLDAVSDRDALAEVVFLTALIGVHASALAEELVLGSMSGVDRVRLDDRFVTTSSLMPHKRNPDLAELIRSEAAPAAGRLVGVLGILKGLPMGYQRDLQTTKPLLFEAVERCRAALGLLAPMALGATYRADPVRAGRSTVSVELADALVRAGVPFRSAHGRVARLVSELEGDGRGLDGATLAELQAAFPEVQEAQLRLPPAELEPELRGSRGGSSRREVERLLGEIEDRVRSVRAEGARERRRLLRLRAELGIPADWPFLTRIERPATPRSPRARASGSAPGRRGSGARRGSPSGPRPSPG
jgi:argininosuccinate lyase